MRTAFLLCLALGVTACDRNSQSENPGAYQQKKSNKVEFVARAPSGHLSPTFDSEAEVKAYIDSHGSDFPTGTELMKR